MGKDVGVTRGSVRIQSLAMIIYLTITSKHEQVQKLRVVRAVNDSVVVGMSVSSGLESDEATLAFGTERMRNEQAS